MNNALKNNIHILISLLIYLFVTIIFTYPASVNLNNVFYGGIRGTDNEGVVWSLWVDKFLNNNQQGRKINKMIAYPFGIRVDSEPIQASGNKFIFWLARLKGEVFTFNFIILSSFILSALFMYLLIFQLTRDFYASFLGGFIFSFCPYHFNKALEHFSLVNIQWIALYFLSIVQFLKKKNIFNAAFLALSFTLIVAFDFYYAFMAIIATSALFIFLLMYKWRVKISFLSKKKFDELFKMNLINFIFLKYFFIALLLIALLNLNNILGIIKVLFFMPQKEIVALGYVRPIKNLFSYSAFPLNYFLPAAYHFFLGAITRPFVGSLFYGRSTIDSTLFLGWTTIILSFVSFRRWKLFRKKNTTPALFKNNEIKNNISLAKDDKDFFIGFFLFLVFIGFIFSMPPYWNFGLFKVYFPSNFLYTFLPMFRTYARFGLLVIFSCSILAGYALQFLLTDSRGIKKILLIIVIICSSIFEFLPIPPLKYYNAYNVPEVYNWLKSRRGEFAIVEYPLGTTYAGEAFVSYNYLYNQRFHQKPLINGAKIGTEAFKIKQKIRNIEDIHTPRILRWLGAKYAILHLDEYRQTHDFEAVEFIGQVPNLESQNGLKLIKRFSDDVVLYEIIAKAESPTL